MNLEFQKIKLHNFFSFADTEVELSNMGFVMVEGRNYCKLDSALSNGAGKSSVFNGICYALTGETANGISNGIENIFTDPNDCWVELYFSADGNDFIVKRTKTPWAKLNITVNGVDKSGKGVRESTKILADYLPDLTSTLVNSIIVLGQGLPNRFTNNKPAQRKEILEKLTKSDFMIESIKVKLEARKSVLGVSLREKEDLKLSNSSKLNVYTTQLSKYNDELNQFKDFGGSESSIQTLLDSLSVKYDELCAEISTLSDSINSTTKKLEELNKNKEQYLINFQSDFDAKINTIDKLVRSKNNSVINLRAEIKSLKNEISRLDAITDICPTCGQKIPGAAKIDTTEHRTKLNELETDLLKKTKELELLEEEKSLKVKELNSEKNRILSELNNNITSVKSEVSKLNIDNMHNNDEKLKLNSRITELTNLKNNYIKLLSDISSTEASIAELEQENNKLEATLSDLRAHADVVQQMLTLAKREFRGVLLVNIIEYINKKVKQYSNKVFGTEELAFYLDENEINITYCDKPYENLSGGEKQKIDVIVQLALRDILSTQLNVHSNIIILDEIFDNLDTQGCSKVIDLISDLNELDSIFIISHHAQDLELTRDATMVVEKDENGISTLKIV